MLDTLRTDQIRHMAWREAIRNACMNPVCAVTGETVADVLVKALESK